MKTPSQNAVIINFDAIRFKHPVLRTQISWLTSRVVSTSNIRMSSISGMDCRNVGLADGHQKDLIEQ